MLPVPVKLDGAVVLGVADVRGLGSTGEVVHRSEGRRQADFAFLALARYPGDKGVYLLYCDSDWRVATDPLPAGLEQALDQAWFEVGDVPFDGRVFQPRREPSGGDGPSSTGPAGASRT